LVIARTYPGGMSVEVPLPMSELTICRTRFLNPPTLALGHEDVKGTHKPLIFALDGGFVGGQSWCRQSPSASASDASSED
jgi:hypothetical protein